MTRITKPPILGEMTAVLKRLLANFLALAFFVGVTAQLMPCPLAQTATGTTADMPDKCVPASAACTHRVPTCVDYIGCAALPVVPVSPTSFAVAFEWTSLDYDLAAESLAGISVKPELSPPIPAA